VRLPLAEPDGVVAVGPPQCTGHAHRRILVVEDDPDARALTRDVLVAAGHQVDVARDGAEGLSRAVALRPDVVVVDIGLPVLDGYGVARGVRDALGDTIRLIAVTGYGQPEDRARALAAGFDRHLVKPVDASVLECEIQDLTGGS
jgi:CheY-like chemotaxis protein